MGAPSALRVPLQIAGAQYAQPGRREDATGKQRRTTVRLDAFQIFTAMDVYVFRAVLAVPICSAVAVRTGGSNDRRM
jgi:hypothetical protein